jgi:hypothetical protein
MVLLLRAFTITEASFLLFFSSPLKIKKISKFFFVVVVDYFCSRNARSFIHSHIKCSAESERETSFTIIKVVRRNAKIC